MKGRNLLFTALIIAAAGVLILLTYKSITISGVATVSGIVFIVAALFNIAVFAGSGRRSGGTAVGNALGWITGAAAFVLGAAMLIFKLRFMEIIPFIFSVLILFGVLFQVFLLVFGTRPLRLPVWLFVSPILLMAASVYVFFQTPGLDDNAIMLATGASLLLFGVTTFVESVIIGRENRRQAKTDMRQKTEQTDGATASDSQSDVIESSEEEFTDDVLY